MKTKLILIASIALHCTLSAGVTRYWIGGGTANFIDGTHWSYASGGGQIGGTISWAIDDVAIFNSSSGSPTVVFTSNAQIGKLQITGSITVTFKPITTASRTIGVNTVANDALLVGTGATLIIKGQDSSTDRDMHVELDNTYGIIASISGTIKVSDDMTGYGEFSREGSYPTINFNAGSTYEHNSKEVGSDIPEAVWNAASTCLISGITIDLPGNLTQSFGNLTWDCQNQGGNFNLPTLPALQGNFSISNTGSGGLRLSEDVNAILTVGGSYIQSGGNFYPSGGSADNIINVGGNFSFTGGILSSPESGSCLFRFNTSGTHTFYKTSEVTFHQKIHFEVMSGAILDMGEAVIDNSSSGYFTLNSGGGIRTAHAQGIASSGASGCIQLTGTRYYSSGSSYTFYRNGSQSTGNALPSPITTTLTIGSTSNATNLTLTNGAVTINGTLILISNASSNSSIVTGTLTYGGSGTLEYRGASPQSTNNKEFPSTSGPFNLKINNGWGISLHDNRSLNGTLSLSNGSLIIGARTLTLNGGITKTGGSLTGGTSSNITFGGTGASTNLPEVILGDLILNRPAGIGLSGNVTVHGTFILTQGGLTLNGFVLAYGSTGTLKYNGSVIQNTSGSEFPASNGPFNLDNSNTTTLNLQFSRTLEGNLALNNGSFAINTNTLTLNGLITGSGSITGGTSSNITFGGTGVSTTLPGITLNNLTIQRESGITMGGEVTVGGTLNLNSGPFSIGANTLVINGIIMMDGGTLAGGTNSNLTFSGTGSAGHLNWIVLNQLILNRASGLYLDDNIEVQGKFIMMNGPLMREGFSMYGPDATLQYQGYVNQTTSDEEWPDTGGPRHLVIINPSGVQLHADKTVEGNLQLLHGHFKIGAHNLTINENILQMFGVLLGGPFSNLTISGMLGGTPIPPVDLRNLVIDRPAGAWLSGYTTIYGTLNLVNGLLMVNSETLELDGGPIQGNPNSLVTNNLSSLVFGGNSPDVYIPSSIFNLKQLSVSNPQGVKLMSDIFISILADISGYLNFTDRRLLGSGEFSLNPFAKLGTGNPLGIAGCILMNGIIYLDSEADFEFNGDTLQQTNFLETSTPGMIRNLIIASATGITVELTEDITVSGQVNVNDGSVFYVGDGINLLIEGR